MKKTSYRAVLALAATLMYVAQTWAQIPAGYYDALRGKKGAELKTAAFNIIKKANVLDYGSGKGSTWWGFYTTDNDNGYVVDRYSNERRKFGNQGSSVSGMNIEHSFPKSWWGGSTTQAYKDLFNLMPSDSKANSSKSNYGMGVVTGKTTYDNGCIKVGAGSQGFYVWQPNDEWKGDFARGYMYMATAYQDYTWSDNAAKNSLTQGDYPTLKEWAYTLYIKWAKEDPVSADEVKRNNAVYRIQGNRNPFIDFPNLMEYIWGDSTAYAFDPSKTVTSEHYSGSTDPVEGSIYAVNFTKDDGDCYTHTVSGPEASTVWTRSYYGWKGTAYISNVKSASESYLLTPEIDLGGYKDARLQFSHAANYVSAPATKLSVEVLADGQQTRLEGFTWPTGKDWTFVESGDIDLTPFTGKKIQIAFHYTSTQSEAGTWEIRDIAITGTPQPTGIGGMQAAPAAFDASKPYQVYDLNGRRLPREARGKGVVVVRQGGHVWKMVR